MAGIVVVGPMETKEGKYIDILSGDSDYIVRYSGGNNAGRTIISEGIKYSLHLLPSGILRKDKICILANGVVINPAVFLQEMDYLNNFNIDMAQIFISDRAHVVMPWHIYLDNLQEQARGKAELGTTNAVMDLRMQIKPTEAESEWET